MLPFHSFIVFFSVLSCSLRFLDRCNRLKDSNWGHAKALEVWNAPVDSILSESLGKKLAFFTSISRPSNSYPSAVFFTVHTVPAWYVQRREVMMIMTVELQRRRLCGQIINCHLLFFTFRVRGDCYCERCNASSGNTAEFIQVYPKRKRNNSRFSARRDRLVNEKPSSGVVHQQA